MNPQSQQKYANKTIKTLSVGMAIGGFASMILGALIPYFREYYGFGYEVSGIILSSHSLGGFIATIVIGILPLYFGRKKSLLFMTSWFIVAFIFLSSGLGNALLVILSCFLLGFAKAGSTMFSNTIVSLLPSPYTDIGYNRIHAGYALGALSSPLCLIALSYFFPSNGWRILIYIITITAFFQFNLFMRMTYPAENIQKEKKKIDFGFVKNLNFWLGSLMLFCYISAEYSITGWLVTYFIDSGLLSTSHSQLMNSLFWLSVFIGRFIGSHIVNKVKLNTLLLIDGLGLTICFTCMFFSTHVISISLSLMGAGLFMATMFPSIFSFSSSSIPGNDFAYSVLSFISNVGGMITPFVIGLIANSFSIEAGMALVVVIIIALLISIIVSISFSKKVKLSQ